MSRVLPLQAVSDGYTYFSCPGTKYVTVQGFNNGIDVGFGVGYPAAVYQPNDEYLALSTLTGPRTCDEIRFKNHVAGQAGQIQVTAQGSDEVGDNPLGGSTTPNFQTINPDGSVGATFTGLINALGLVLPAATSFNPPPSAPNNVVWKRTDNGALVAEITSGWIAGSDAVAQILSAYAQDAAGNSSVVIHATDDQGLAQTSLQIVQKARGTPPSVQGQIGGATEVDVIFPNGKAAMILGENGYSSFPQIVAGVSTQWEFCVGYVTLTFPGASVLTNTINTSAGTFILGTGAVPFGGAGGAFCLATYFASSFPLGTAPVVRTNWHGDSPATFDIQAYNATDGQPGAGTTVTAYWLSVGLTI